jgi:hypothetical protein
MVEILPTGFTLRVVERDDGEKPAHEWRHLRADLAHEGRYELRR